MRLEPLEDRRLLAIGPQLAGIQPNDGSLLTDGQVRNVAPVDLTFRFSQPIDPSTLSGIRITRAGLDGRFQAARATTDFNTSGAVVMDFVAVDPANMGNGIRLDFIKNALGTGVGPRISVTGKTIHVELNSTVGSETRALQLRDALNNHPDVKALITASIRAGSNTSTNIAAPAVTYSPVVLAGANASAVRSDFNVGRSLEIEFIANQAGAAGQGIEIVVTRQDRGGVSPPVVQVQNRVITVQLNSNAAAPTTARELVNAINAHAQAGALVTARVSVGLPETAIGNRVINYSPLRLAAIDDVVVEPGFIGLGASANEVVMRFKEPLPDDLYHVDVLGTGVHAVRSVDGTAFGDATPDGLDNGVDFDLNFELNLGPQILAVVPQPITRNAVTQGLQQARDQIVVYFNNDDLHPTPVTTGQLAVNPTVVDPAFYQLIFTRDTVQNTDDVVYRPTSIQYDPATDMAVLRFATALENLGSGPGTFRLRIGTDEALPLPPTTVVVPPASTTSDFNTQGAVVVSLVAQGDFAAQVRVEISKRDRGGPGAPRVSVSGTRIAVELNTNAGNATTAQQFVDALNSHAQASQLVTAAIASGAGATNIAATAVAGSVLRLAGLGSSFDSATELGQLGAQGMILSAAIEPQEYNLQFPGAISEPGHRDLRADLQRHYLVDGGDTLAGITTAFYNFQDQYGFDPDGRVLTNAITETQKERAREAFTLYAEYLGIQFVETANLGMTIATGDIRAVAPDAPTGPGGVVGAAGGGLNGLAVMDLQDFNNPGDDEFGAAWFRIAMRGIGMLLGMGFTNELPPLTILEDELALAFPENTVDPTFPGNADIIHGQHLFRPEGKDIDLYRFEVTQAGIFSAETFAERLPQTSLLDTTLRLYRLGNDGQRELIAQNDDYFSNDSFLELPLSAGVYWLGVSASGNDRYDPTIEDSGLGGRSEGDYQLRVQMRPEANRSIVDATGVRLDGDGNGVPGGVYEMWFRAQTPARTIYVDKAAVSAGNGTLGAPYRNISAALTAARSGDIVRVVGNGGADRNLATTEDNLAYEIGFNQLGNVLADGASLDVPQGVTLMIDSGAIVKLRRAAVNVGSSSVTTDRSAAALQVLGTPILLSSLGTVVRDPFGAPVPGSVYFTSLHDKTLGTGVNPDQAPPPAFAGDWGGIAFRNDIDAQDRNRFNYEAAGAFLNHVNFADMRYGGGIVVISGLPQVVAPVEMLDARPTLTFNRITLSADAALAASPNSFAETNFHEPGSQFVPFTSDYRRVGPEIHGNVVTDNSINGLFVRITTPAGTTKQPLTVSAGWDDADITHVLADRLIVRGTPGGAVLDVVAPSVQVVTLAPATGGQLDSGEYSYRLVFVDAGGNEGAPSNPTALVAIDAATGNRSVQLNNLPVAASGFVSRRLYRSDKTADPDGPYVLVAELNANSTSFLDFGGSLGRLLQPGELTGLRPRLDARLSIAPGVVVKFNGGGMETTFGADLYAEGRDGAEVVFTSIHDSRYGRGGTLQTVGGATPTAPAAGDWGGIYAGHATRLSVDHAVIAYGGGEMNIEGTFAAFNSLEIHQAQARVAHSVFEQNASGVGGQAGFDRHGRGFNRASALFVRGAQPVIIDNTFLDNAGAAISIDANSLNYQSVSDHGRSTYGVGGSGNPLDALANTQDNQGPLVRLNRLDRNAVNGMQVRGATLTTEGVWDDTDIVHVLRNETVYVPDKHTFGGLRLQSNPNETLVVKLDGPQAGITATGRPLDIEDRIGGAIQIVGQPGHPVVMTSINDCTVGAGFTPWGVPQTDTLNSGACRGTAADVVVLMDESDLMLLPQQFSAGLITGLEASLLNVGIGTGLAGANRYGLAGFGGDVPHDAGHAHPVGPNGELFGSATDYVLATAGLTELGVQADGYSGIHYILNNYPFRADAQKFIILVTNGDRDIVDPQHTYFSTLAALSAADVTLNVIIPAFVNDSAGNTGLTIDASQTVYLEDGAGGFTTSPNGTITPRFVTSVTDYADLAFATGGVAGDVEQIQTGGLTVTSLGSAVVSQVTQQTSLPNIGRPGDWRSLRLDQYSHDRNVALVVENESRSIVSPGTNATVNGAQFLGTLAPNEKSGDDNRRLGFEVHGVLTARNDVDLYSFTATAGTQVWLDIDRTSAELDSVLELIDSSGRVLARSNDSAAEADNPSLLFRSSLMAAGTVNPLRKAGYDPQRPTAQSALAIPDYYSTNPRDAGMRVVLPGQPGATATYHVRVRSAGDNIEDVGAGKSLGRYQLQIRLRELDEAPGSAVSYANIRYATNGIEILGQPGHSPLLGEASETEAFGGAPLNSNNTLATAQDIGNLLQTDRGVLSLAGDIQLPTDVDFYRLTVEYDSINQSGPRPYVSTVFDIDYADGLARANTEMWVFDSQGRLILRGGSSNVTDDRARPLQGSDMSDLSRGSAGALDPYIGPVELPAGPDDLNPFNVPPLRGVYYVAVTSNAQMPEELRQYLEPNPPNPYVRLEPISAVQRIAEDRVGSSGGSTGMPPQIPVLMDTTSSAVPFHLGDVTLFVSTDGGLAPNTISTLRTVDPFTGRPETVAGSFREPIGDIAMRGDGNLFAFSLGPDNFNGPINDATTGTYIQIDSATGAATKLSDDGVETYVEDPANPGTAERAPVGQNNDGVGISYNAIAYRSRANSQFFNGYVVGTRNDSFDNNPIYVDIAGVEFLENILYHFDINTGVVANRSPNSSNRQNQALLNGAGTQKIEFGEILTFTRIVPQFPEIGDTFTITINGKSINYTAAGGVGGFATVQEVVSGLAAAWNNAAGTVPEFAAYQVLNSSSASANVSELRVRLVDPTAAYYDIVPSTTDGGSSGFLQQALIVEGGGPGGMVTGIDFVGGELFAVTDRGGLYQVSQSPQFVGGQFFFSSNNLATYVRSSAIDLMTAENGGPIRFSGLTAGPPSVEDGRYANLLFGISQTGNLYAFNTAGELQPVFVNDSTSAATGLFGATGVAFSTLDRNLWTVTGNRGNDEGHGFNGPGNSYEPFDRSRLDVAGSGGSSFYFGNDRSTNVGGNQSFSNTGFIRNYDFPGGAYGSLISRPFSLVGYSAEDKPVLYFNYFLETEDTDYDPTTNPLTPTRDSFRVFVGGDNGEWTLVGTNNTFQDAQRLDEFDIGQNDLSCLYPAFAGEPCVQKIFDNTDTWRQARVSLSNFAGMDNLRLRFDFSTAGSMNLGDTMTVGSELRAIAGSELRDGQSFQLGFTNRLEFDLGYTLVAPNGAAIDDGDSFTVTDASGRVARFEFDNNGRFAHDITAVPGRQLRDGDRFTVTVGGLTQTFEFDSGYSLFVPAAGANFGGVDDGETFTIDGVVFEFDSDGTVVAGNQVIQLIVDTGLQIPALGGGLLGITDGQRVTINDGAGGPNVVFEFDNNGNVTAGARRIDITNLELRIPVSGGGLNGVADGHTFAINDGFGGPDVVFEFDMNNNVAPGNRPIGISDRSTQDEVAAAMVNALRLANIGLNPVNRGGGVVRLGLFRHTVDSTGSPTLVRNVVAATQNEIADRLADSILNSGLGLVARHDGQGLVRLGSTTHVVNTANAPSVAEVTIRASQNELANAIMDAIQASPVAVTPLNLGNGEIYLGRTVDTLDVSGTPSLAQSGAPGVTQAGATPVVIAPTQTATEVAASMAAAISASPLNILATAVGSIVDLPAGVQFAPNGTPLTPTGIWPVTFSNSDSAAAVAGSIRDAIGRAFAPVPLTGDLLNSEANDRLATAIDIGLPGGAARFTASGFIGDNPAFPLRPGVDVDYMKLNLRAGETVVMRASASGFSALQPALRLFDATGQELAVGTQASPITYNVLTTGTYYLAVSSIGNLSYEPNYDGSAELRLLVPAQGGAVGGLTDGERFTIDDGSGASPRVFEFDSNGQLFSPGAIAISLADVLLQVPSAGTNPGGIRDGDTLVINDNRGSGDVVFEFDTDGVVSPGNVRISVAANSSAAAVATALGNTLAGANIGLSPSLQGSTGVRLGTVNHSVNIAGTPTLNRVSLPWSQQQIAVFLRDAIRDARIGLLPVISFGGSVSLDVRGHRVDTSLARNLGLVVPSNTGAYEVNIDVTPIRSLVVHSNGNRLNLENAELVVPTGLPASFLEGGLGTTIPGRTPVRVHEGMSAVEVAEAIKTAIGQSTAGYVQQIAAVSGFQIADGEMFSISDGRVTTNFEFESGFSLQIPNPATNTRSILDGEYFTITSSGITRTFEFDDNRAVTAGNIGIRFNDVVLGVPFGGVVFGGVNDGDTLAISVTPGAASTIFEFDTDGVVTPGNLAIAVVPTATQNDVANALVQALISADIGLAPQNLGQGRVQLGVTTHFVDVTGTPSMTRQTVLLTQDQLAERMVTVIGGAGINLTPTYMRNGLIHLGGNAGHAIDVTGALALSVIGRPGLSDPSAIEIAIFPATSVSPIEVASLIRSAINTARVTRGLNVTANQPDARRINLVGPTVLTDFTHAPSLPVTNAGDSVKVYENIVKVIGQAITDPGPLGYESSLAGDSFGAFTTSGPPNATNYPGALRGMDNAYEGVYLDDFIIGFAERGEMVVGATVNASFTANSELLNNQLPLGLVPHNEIHVGPYQLEIRQGETVALVYQDARPSILPVRAFDTNDRLSGQVSLEVPAGAEIVEGQTLVLSDGTRTVTFEFDDLGINNGVRPGNVRIAYSTSDSQMVMARRVRDAINSSAVQATLGVTAALADGTVTGTASTSSRINLFGPAVVSLEQSQTTREVAVSEPNDTLATATPTGIGAENIATFVGRGQIGDNNALAEPSSDVDMFEMQLSAGETITIDVYARRAGSTLDSVLRVFDAAGQEIAFNDDFNGLDSYLEFTAPTSGRYFVGISGFWNYFYSPLVAGSGFTPVGGFSVGDYELRISGGLGGFRVLEATGKGDSNVARDQGQLLIQSSAISNSAQFGILSDAGTRDGSGNAPHLGPVRVTRELNASGLAPGVTITNNILARNGQGGIHISGDAVVAGTQRSAVPFARVINNTIVGTGSGVGIQVSQNASPTLLNNIVAELGTGISVDATSASTVLGGTVFKQNTTNTMGIGLGSFPVTLADTAPLFLDSRANNFYPAAGSRAIDSSVNTLQDRPELVTVKSPLGLGLSPILAPDLDALGQVRVDDPQVSPLPGQGANVFKDRGALDRADFSGPTAVLIDPQDNDVLLRDSDPRVSFVNVSNEILTHFSIQLMDGLEPNLSQAGSGADANTVRGDRVSVYRDNQKLVEGVDYSFNYDATNNIIRLTPLAGIWEVDRVYEIDLSNDTGFVITTASGAVVQDGEQFSVTDASGNTVIFEYDSGFSLHVPQTLTLQVPAAGGAALTDGETFTITDGTRTAIFEFDTNGATTLNNIPIAISPADSANDIANKLVAAIGGTALGLSPVNIVNYFGRAVHLGSTSVHVLDTTNTSLTQTGVAGGIENGQTFAIDDGAKVVTFQFTTSTGPTGTNQPVRFLMNQTHEQIADAIVAAIISARVGLTPTHAANSEGLVHLGGTTRHQVDVSDSELGLSGQPGVTPGWGIRIPTLGGAIDFSLITDGQTFTITNGITAAVRFELDSDGITTPGNRVITFNRLTTTTSQLAAAIAVAIRNANLGLNPTSSSDGVILLGGTAAYSMDTTDTELLEIGQPGLAAAVPVPFKPGETYTPGVPVRQPIFDEKAMALSVRDAINGAVAQGRLAGVTASVRVEGGTVAAGEVLVEGATDVTAASAVLRPQISDVAGNSLKPNRNDGSTRFTIFVSSGLDYGDAPASYGTLAADDGARHQIVSGFHLGATVDADFDGQPTVGADGDDNDGLDDEDGVIFNTPIQAGQPATITVTASAAGFLDAWIDFNRDGDFLDAGEQIFLRRALNAGDNVLTINVPGTIGFGDSYARFRFSSMGGLGPTGFAPDGEVEDYRVNLVGNPWHNARNAFDVNGDTFVTPIDALLIINYLNTNGAGMLPLPPPVPFPGFLDVNASNPAGPSVEPADALLVINRLNAGTGEGEQAQALAAVAFWGDASEGEAAQTVTASQADGMVSGADVAAPAYFTSLVDHRISASTVAAAASGDQAEASSADLAWNVLAVPAEADSTETARLLPKSADDLEDVLELLSEDTNASTAQIAHDAFFSELV